MKYTTLLVAASLAFASAAFAGPKDKSSNTLIDIDSAGVINNNVSKTKIKSKGCSLQIQAKDTTLGDGDVAICIADADALGFGGNSIIVVGEAKAGKLKIKADLTEATIAGLGCGVIPAVSYNTNVRCYEDDATYRSDTGGAGTWEDACTGAGMITGDGPGTTTLKVNDTQAVVVGICQGTTEGQRIPGPASQRFAVEGQLTPAL